jgi:adenine-specific DNA-methyltransferase
LSELTTRERADAPFLPFTRKYLGSKRLLRAWIADRICETAGTPRSFLDGFFGTGAISFAMGCREVPRIVAVDVLRSNCAILRGFTVKSPRLPSLIDRLNFLKPVHGYIAENYGGTYFTLENCHRMDAARGEIHRLRAQGEITDGEHDALLASFLLAADRVANTIGQYDAFLKNIDGESVAGGRHLVDDRVRSAFTLRGLEMFPGATVEVVEGDMISLAPRIDVEVAYYDPPYNGRQYCDNYHVLENIARWEKPPLFGKTRKFDRTGLRSPFSQRAHAADALRRLVEGTRAGHIFLSYSSEGILSRDEILSILSVAGQASAWEIPYPVFGNGAGVSVRRNVIEYLFHVTGAAKGQG